jgi:hypothetical protein
MGTGHRVAQGAIVAVEIMGCCTSIVKEKIPQKLGHRRGGLHWVNEGRKLHAGTGQKSNRLCSKVSKIRAKRIKHKIKDI